MSGQKIRRHEMRYRHYRPVVFCVECGSTMVDQNSIDELRCNDCGNTMPWDGRLFSIRRGPSPYSIGDVRDAVVRDEC